MPEALTAPPTPIADVFVGLPAIVRECVDSGCRIRHDLRQPWCAGDHVYATDGTIVVRVPLAELPPDVEARLAPFAERKPVNAPGLFDSSGPWAAEPVALPAVVERLVCPECGGTDGPHAPKNDESVELAPGYWMASHFVGMLRRHGATAYLPEPPVTGLTGRPLRFVIGGAVEGLVMPQTSREVAR